MLNIFKRKNRKTIEYILRNETENNYKAYEAGWDDALNSQWNDLNEVMPEIGEKVLVLKNDKTVVISYLLYETDSNGNITSEIPVWSGGEELNGNAIAWSRIPVFTGFE